jgi:RimJ/RimL family protein N-acetyltransferase
MTTPLTGSPTGLPAASGPAQYELRVAGHLDDHWSAVLGDLTLRHRGLLSVNALAPDPASDGGQGPPLQPALTHPLRTPRLTLRAGTAGDADATWAYRRLDSVGEWLTEIPTDVERYRTTFSEPARLAATVIVEQDGRVVGDFMLRIEDAWAQAEVADRARGCQAEIGWVLDPAHGGHGYATEAVRALLDHCFSELHLHRVVATCFAANDSSRRLMERVGMRCEGHAVADSLHRSGRWLDTLTYAALATDRPR